MSVKIMCGISGAGKSTYILNNFPTATVVSADSFFTDKAGNYCFDPTKIGEAHAECLRDFVGMVSCGYHFQDCLVVDNTNCTVAEIAPYAALAQAYNWDLEIIILECDPGVAYYRNGHGAPFHVCEEQAEQLATLADSLPPWWPVTRVKVD